MNPISQLKHLSAFERETGIMMHKHVHYTLCANVDLDMDFCYSLRCLCYSRKSYMKCGKSFFWTYYVLLLSFNLMENVN